MGPTRILLAVLAAAMVAAACGSAGGAAQHPTAHSVCGRDGDASLCLVGAGDAFQFRASGLKPGSRLALHDGQGGGLSGVADASGAATPGGETDVGGRITVRMSGTERTGRSVNIAVTWISTGAHVPSPATTGALP